MAPVIACAQELGANSQAIAGALRAIVEELEGGECGNPRNSGNLSHNLAPKDLAFSLS
jgi:hypothetical protein